MYDSEWSRSRYWFCHFLYSRHDREPIAWSDAAARPSRLSVPLRRWLDGRHDPGHSGLWLIEQAVRDCGHDPAYVQSLRLLVKEQHYHRELLDRLVILTGGGQPAPVRSRRRSTLRRWCGHIGRSWLGARFEMSVRLLADLLDVTLMTLVERSGPDAAVGGVCRNIINDKRAHIMFATERLTMLYADFNFIRRNVRRLRLRLMWAILLAATIARHRRLIRACGSTRARFLVGSMRQFNGILERMVPYRRDALLSSLLNQRQDPYAKPWDCV